MSANMSAGEGRPVIGQAGQKIVALTAYDYPSARLLDETGVDLILVGDSLGMVVLGYEDTTLVTIEEMEHHTRACRRGVKRARLVSDLPYLTYESPKTLSRTRDGSLLPEPSL